MEPVTDVTLQDYLNQHIPAEIAVTKFDPVYMASKSIYTDLSEGEGLLSPENLVILSDEDLDSLRTSVDSVVIPQLERDIAHYEGTWLSGEGNLQAAAEYTSVKYPEYQSTLAMGLGHDMYVSTLGAIPAENVIESIQGTIEDFSMRAEMSFEQAATWRYEIKEIAAEISENSFEALEANIERIEALPENGQQVLRQTIEAQLDEKVAEAPELASEVEALKEALDQKVAAIAAPQEPQAEVAPSAPSQQLAPVTP